MKNGRRSAKNVSNADRLTTAGSASTCPKSGLIVVVSVRPGVTAYFMSRPAAPDGADDFTNGLPVPSWRVKSAAVYGTSSSRFGDAAIDSPPRSPNDDT